MRPDTASQLAHVYTCQQSQFLADWQHQQVNRTAHPLFPVASGKREVKEASGGQRYISIYAGSGREQEGGARPPVLTYTHAHAAN